MFNPDIELHTEIEGLKSFRIYNFIDERGQNFEIYKKSIYKGLPKFNLDSCSISVKNTIRGFHGDLKNDKLIQCLYGKIQFFVIDRRPESKTFDNIKEFLLDYKLPTQIFVPAGCLNAHAVLSNEAVFYYKWSKGYCTPSRQTTIKWNNPKYNLKWLVKNPILSNRDK